MALELDRSVAQKLALEAFDMILEGKTKEPKIVFTALEGVMPGNRPSSLGLAMIKYAESRRTGHLGDACDFSGATDPFLLCLQALHLLKAGSTSAARVLLQTVAEGSDPDTATFARDIVQFEL